MCSVAAKTQPPLIDRGPRGEYGNMIPIPRRLYFNCSAPALFDLRPSAPERVNVRFATEAAHKLGREAKMHGAGIVIGTGGPLCCVTVTKCSHQKYGTGYTFLLCSHSVTFQPCPATPGSSSQAFRTT
jgi:hypothetical protein